MSDEIEPMRISVSVTPGAVEGAAHGSFFDTAETPLLPVPEDAGPEPVLPLPVSVPVPPSTLSFPAPAEDPPSLAAGPD